MVERQSQPLMHTGFNVDVSIRRDASCVLSAILREELKALPCHGLDIAYTKLPPAILVPHTLEVPALPPAPYRAQDPCLRRSLRLLRRRRFWPAQSAGSSNMPVPDRRASVVITAVAARQVPQLALLRCPLCLAAPINELLCKPIA
jgi:hypothetical protein